MKKLGKIGKIEAGVLVGLILLSGAVSAGALRITQSPGQISEAPTLEWINEIINNRDNVEIFCTSLVFDQNNNPNVFYVTTNNELIRSIKTSIGWFHELVDIGVISNYVSAKMDETGLMHVSYAKDGLMYITGDETGMNEPEIVDPLLQVKRNTFISLDLDSNNKPQISYYDAINKDLIYAKNAGNIWSVSVIDASGDVGQYCSMAIDSNDIVHIAYYDATLKDLKYAKKTSLAVLTMVADSDNRFGLYSAIALDVMDKPHIVHSGTKGVKHTFESSQGRFISELVDRDETQCFTPSITISDDNKINVGYSKTIPKVPYIDIDVIFAKKTSSGWQLETAFDGRPFKSFSYGIDISLDQSNDPALSFVDLFDGRALKFAFR